MKKAISVLILICLSITMVSCSVKTPENVTNTNEKGRYVEQDIGIDDEFSLGLFTGKDNKINYFTIGNPESFFTELEITHYEITKENNIAYIDTNYWLKAVGEKFKNSAELGYALSLYMNEEILYVLAQSHLLADDGKKELDSVHIFICQNGEVESIELDTNIFDDKESYFRLEFANSGYFIVSNNSSAIYAFNRAGEVISFNEKYFNYSSFTFFNENLYMLKGDGEAVIFSFPELKVESLVRMEWATVISSNNENFYAVINSNKSYSSAPLYSINKYSADASSYELLLDGSNYTFGSYVTTDIVVDNNENIVISCYSGNDTKLLRYVYDENATMGISDGLKIYSLYEQPVIRAAILQWKTLYPNVEVIYEVGFTSDETAITVEDAIRLLNTEILAGGGPDILVLDNLPIKSMLEKGFLQNLEKYIDTSGLAKNIMETYRTGNGLYAIPAKFSMTTIGGKTEIIQQMNNWKGLLSVIETHGKDSVDFISSDVVFDLLYPSWAEEIWKDDNFNEDAFKNFVESTTEISGLLGLKTAKQIVIEEE